MKFSELVQLSEQPSKYVLNAKGKILIQKYIEFVDIMKQWFGQDTVVSILSNVEATDRATNQFKLAKKLSILTNDGQSDIDANNYVINDNDELMQYLIKV